MLIILFLLIIHSILFNKYRRYSRQLVLLSFIIIFSCSIWLLLMDFELKTQGIVDRDYGSDANYYWDAMVNTFNGDSSKNYLAPNYVEWGALILRLSPSISIFWVKLCNIFLYSLASNLMFILLIKRSFKIEKRQSMFLLISLFLNGTVIWTVIRNLKETLFVFILTIFLFLIEEFLNKNTKKVFYYLFIVGIVYVGYRLLNGIRPLGGIMAFISFIGIFTSFVIRNSNKSKIKLLSVSLTILVMISIISILRSNLNLLLAFKHLYLEQHVLSEFLITKLGFLGYVILIIRFLLGPGPIRSLQQLVFRDIFLVSTTVGDILILMGSILWWLELIMLFFKWFENIKTIKSWIYNLDFVLICAVITLAYSIIGGGTGDTRLRAMIYFFSIPLFISIFYKQSVG